MCKGVAGMLFGHKFKPIITRSAANLPAGLRNISGEGAVDFMDTLREETFEALYCQRCGEVLTKEAMQ